MKKFLPIIFIIGIIFYGMYSNYQKKLERKLNILKSSKVWDLKI